MTGGKPLIRFAYQVALLAVLAWATTGSLFAQTWTGSPAAGDDPVLRAMLAELQRSKTQIKLPDAQAPYYIDYRLQDVDQYVAEAAFGSVRLLCGHASACCASWCG